MATRRPGDRAFRPTTEGLESRKLLTKVITGVDIDGDTWELRLLGPGDLSVVNQPDANGDPIPLGEPALIDSILIGGPDPTQTRLVGVVNQAEGGDGRVYFQNMREFNGAAVGVAALNGIHVIDMPDFWLGRTSAEATIAGVPAGLILIPDGVNTLRFGGADVTYTPPGGTPLNQNGRNDELIVALGLPRSWGTSIIIDQSISNAEPGVGTSPATQNGVQFSVVGRVNTFQANEIVGDADLPPAPLAAVGGTQLFSTGGQEQNAASLLEGQIVGQFGFVRVGGNATNFTVETDTRISNFYVGGETANVILLAPEGSRNIYFGKGMDEVTILTDVIMTLQANRGAIDSTVASVRPIGQMTIGGDVVGTQILSGYDLSLSRVFATQQLPQFPPPVISGGAINQLLIAGDVVDSIIAASVDPVDGIWGNENDLVLPYGKILGKVEGSVNNENVLTASPSEAFFARTVKLQQGPIIPPAVPEAPFPHAGAKPTGSRVAEHLLPSDPARRRRLPNSLPTGLVNAQGRRQLAAAPNHILNGTF